MFRNTFQKGFLSVFHSIGSHPLLIWDSKVSNGYIKRITDEDVKSLALEIRGINVETVFISAPSAPCKSLAIKLPFLVIVVKNLMKTFSFEIQILDDQNMLRRFRSSNYQTKTVVSSFSTRMPLALNCGWNQIQLNLADFTRRAYGTNYMEAVRITIHANCRLRSIYFCDRLYSDDEKPEAFKFMMPGERKMKAGKAKYEPKIAAKKKIEVVEEPKIVESVRPTSQATDIDEVIEEIIEIAEEKVEKLKNVEEIAVELNAENSGKEDIENAETLEIPLHV
jgi:hypothetical protein